MKDGGKNKLKSSSFNNKIEAGEGNQIEVSYIGYKSYSFFVDDTFKRFEIFLEEDAFEMDNVVVTALGIAREEKYRLAGSSYGD